MSQNKKDFMPETIDIIRIREKIIKVSSRVKRGGVVKKSSNLLYLIDNFENCKFRIKILSNAIFCSKVVIVITIIMIIWTLVTEASSPTTGLLIPINLPMDIANLLSALDSLVSLLVGATISMYFLARFLERIQVKICMECLGILHNTLHLLDLMHIGKKPISLGYNEDDSDQIALHERQEKSIEFLEVLLELVSMGGKIGVVYGALSDDLSIVNKSRSLEELTYHISTAVWKKIDFLEKEEEAES